MYPCSSDPRQIQSRSNSLFRLRLGLLLRLRILFLFLLLLAQLLVRLALQARLLRRRLLNRFEEALHSTLLRRLHVLLQFGGTVADSVLAEVLLLDEKLDESFDVWCFPLEVAFGGVGGADVRLEEEEASVSEGPVVGNGELLLVVLDVSNHAFEVLVVADQFEGGGGADALDGVEVVAAEEDAEIDELHLLVLYVSPSEGIPYLLPLHAETLHDLVQVDLQNWLFALLAEGEMPQQNGCVECERVHILTCSGIDLSTPRQRCTLCLRLSWRNDVWNAHQLQQPLALLVVLPRDSDRPSRELLHVFCCACLFGFLGRSVSFRFPLESLCKLAGFEFRRRAVEDVEGLDAIVNHAESTVEEAHEM
jgi:hypothetical protein